MKNIKNIIFFFMIIAVNGISSEKAGKITHANRSGFQIMLVVPTNATGLEAYTLQEVKRIFKVYPGVEILAKTSGDTKRPNQNMVVIGTAENNSYIAQLLKDGFLEAELHKEGYSVKCAPHPENQEVWLLAIAGADNRGVFYGLRDIEHYEL